MSLFSVVDPKRIEALRQDVGGPAYDKRRLDRARRTLEDSNTPNPQRHGALRVLAEMIEDDRLEGEDLILAFNLFVTAHERGVVSTTSTLYRRFESAILKL